MSIDITTKKEQAQKILERAEEINRTTKNFKQYFVEMILMLDTFYKAQFKSTKSFQGAIIYEDKEPVSVQIGNLQKYFLELVNYSQTKLNELENSDFNLENIKKGKKSIIEISKTAEKKLDKCYDLYNKNQQKYEKQSSEFKQKYSEYQEAQKTGYNITLSQKQETKIRSFVKEIEQQEQLLQQCLAEMNGSIQNYSSTLRNNFNSMKVLFSNSVEAVLELIKQFAIIHYKITEQVIGSIQSTFLPPLIAASAVTTETSKIPLTPPQQPSLSEMPQENSEITQISLSNSETTTSTTKTTQNSSQTSQTVQIQQQQNPKPFSSVNFVQNMEKLLERFETQSQNQSEESIRVHYLDQAKSVIDKFKKSLEDRSKNVKNLKGYISEIGESFEFIQKNLVKHMANRYRTADTALSQKYTEVLNVLHYIIEGLSETYKQLSNFINSKGSILQGILNEHSNMDKALTYLQQRIIKSYQSNENGILLQNEYSQIISGTLTKIMNQEQTHSRLIYSLIHSFFTEMLKMQQNKQSFLQKAIDNVMISQDEVQDQIKSFFTKDEQMFNVQDQKENIEAANSKQNSDLLVFKKLFNLPQEFQQDYIVEQNQRKQEELSMLSSPLKDSTKEQDSVKISESLRKKFNVPQNDFVVDSYNCSYSAKISLHGKIYVFNTMIGFHSNFNSRTLLGTILCLQLFFQIYVFLPKNIYYFIINQLQIIIKVTLCQLSHILISHLLKRSKLFYNKTTKIYKPSQLTLHKGIELQIYYEFQLIERLFFYQ